MEEEKKGLIVNSLVILGLVIVFAFLGYTILSDDTYDKEYFVIEGKVIDVIPVIDDEGKIDYLHVYFDTGEKYRIKTNTDLDLTINSKLILEVYRFPNLNEDFIYIDKIIKAPTEKIN